MLNLKYTELSYLSGCVVMVNVLLLGGGGLNT